MSHTFVNKNGKTIERTPCQIYSRVVGFITPVSNYNHGKKSEFYSRKFYRVETSMNSKFIEEYSCCNKETSAYDLIKTDAIKVPVACEC